LFSSGRGLGNALVVERKVFETGQVYEEPIGEPMQAKNTTPASQWRCWWCRSATKASR
jgi:hypothetical protein